MAASRRPLNHGLEVTAARAAYEPESLAVPFGFKGRYLSELRQVAVRLETSAGGRGLGLGTQSVLWSDEAVFAAHSPEEGEELMYSLTRFALSAVEGREFDNPLDLLDGVLEETFAFGRQATGRPELRKTFALNSLVALDNAAWLAWARENGFDSFERMVPAPFGDALSARHNKIASVPVVGYGLPVVDVARLVDDGFFILKIKLGAPGLPEEMLAADLARLEEIHRAVGRTETAHTAGGRILYYLDCNGRYESLETLLRLVDYLERTSIAGQVLLVEEPFGEGMEVDLSAVPLPVAADESAHTAADTVALIEMGYRAIALKPVAKTLSETLRIARVAFRAGIPCFCADLTVNPVLAEWNRNVAARLTPLPGLELGLMEANGHQLYEGWNRMSGYHPAAGKEWTVPRDGLYSLRFPAR